MEKNINLAKILNGKPVNTKLWSPLFGDVYTSIQYSFKDAFDKFAFADLVPFGVKIDE